MLMVTTFILLFPHIDEDVVFLVSLHSFEDWEDFNNEGGLVWKFLEKSKVWYTYSMTGRHNKV